MSTEPTLSVVMCNYNHAHFLEESLTAILTQSRPADEVIVVDDASTDESVEVIERLRDRFSELVLVQNPVNVGVTATVTRGLALATGDFVYTAAADDRVYPGFFEVAMQALAEHPEAGVCFGRNGVIDHTTGDVRLGGRLFVPDGFYSPEALRELVPRGFQLGGLTTIARRDALEEAGGFLPELRYYNDWFAFQVLAFRYGVHALSQVVAACRHLPTSYSHAAARRQKIETLETLFETLDSEAFADVVPMFKLGAFRSLRWPGASFLLFHPRNWRWVTVPYLKLLCFDVAAMCVPESTRQFVRRKMISRVGRTPRGASSRTGATSRGR